MTDCKFKDFDALLNGYKALEKQFTKKCQEVAQLKQMCQSGTNNTSGTSEFTPPLSQEEFFSSYPNAERFRTEIVNNVTAPKYSKCYDAYVRCYLDIVDGLDVGKLLQDKQFVQQYIVSNDAIVDAVLDKVFSSSAPVLIGGRGGDMSVALPTRPKTIAEASLLAKEYFK